MQHPATKSGAAPNGQQATQRKRGRRGGRRRGKQATELRQLRWAVEGNRKAIEDLSKARREPQPSRLQEDLDAELGERYADKREMRREIYADAPELEGRDFRRHHPGVTR